mmetsp:Transcript_10525/g.31422  ORF Transcript_10525/g.31422 Transcript_10525/m.31422 type:complete len:92 (-) Transcript_10525:57-332(-)
MPISSVTTGPELRKSPESSGATVTASSGATGGGASAIGLAQPSPEARAAAGEPSRSGDGGGCWAVCYSQVLDGGAAGASSLHARRAAAAAL